LGLNYFRTCFHVGKHAFEEFDPDGSPVLGGKKTPSATNSYNMFDRCFAYPVKVGKGQAGYFGQSILAGSAWRRQAEFIRIQPRSFGS